MARSASPATPDWEAAIESTHKLADLEPQTIGAGYGKPMSGGDVAGQLREFASAVKPPEHGRKDPLGLSLIAGAGALLTLGLASVVKARVGRPDGE